jgi:hypothetical protein
MKVSGQLHAPYRFTPGERAPPPVAIRQETGWAPEPVCTLWYIEKFLDPAGNRIQAVQPVARRYTD